MTERVRIEKADNSSYKVVVQVWRKSDISGQPDTLEETKTLHCAADIAEFYIHQGKYLVVKETL